MSQGSIHGRTRVPPPPCCSSHTLNARLRSLLQLAVPLLVQSVSSMLMLLIATISVGHLNNPTELVRPHMCCDRGV